ncbi:MAG: hypothetical protein G01um101444_164 [Parcubacteria group bacterium Gr01-1014_44]|nr:MAG: hypothetical protein G01um101444_164 [Parcubacteria group bacterium Gr01-1014_44]
MAKPGNFSHALDQTYKPAVVSCSLFVSPPSVYANNSDTWTWTGTSSPSGYVTKRYGTKNGVQDVFGDDVFGSTNFSKLTGSRASQDGVGDFTRWFTISDPATGALLCTSNTATIIVKSPVPSGELRGKVFNENEGKYISAGQDCPGYNETTKPSGVSIDYTGPVSGRVVMNLCSSTTNHPIFSVPNLPAGTYTVKVNYPNGWTPASCSNGDVSCIPSGRGMVIVPPDGKGIVVFAIKPTDRSCTLAVSPDKVYANNSDTWTWTGTSNLSGYVTKRYGTNNGVPSANGDDFFGPTNFSKLAGPRAPSIGGGVYVRWFTISDPATGALLCTSNTATLTITLPTISREQLTFSGVGSGGIFDPSLENDDSRIWMSYSAVENPRPFSCAGKSLTLKRVETRLAYSDNQGANWVDGGVAIPSEDVCLPAPYHLGTWMSETPTIIKDMKAPASERWKIISHRYLWVQEDGDFNQENNKKFDFGWYGLRAAASPELLKNASEKKLAGAAYQNSVLGEPATWLNKVHPALSDCLFFGEPGGLSDSTGFYLTTSCFTLNPATFKLALLKYNGSSWSYVGTSFNQEESSKIGSEKTMTAASLFKAGNQAYLMATKHVGGLYSGCYIFGINLANGEIQKEAGAPKILQSIEGIQSVFNGACGYNPASRESGIVFGELTDMVTNPMFKIFKTFVNYPSVSGTSIPTPNALSDVVLVKLATDPKVYKLENGVKRWITSPDVFNREGFLWTDISSVNEMELGLYPNGNPIQ